MIDFGLSRAGEKSSLEQGAKQSKDELTSSGNVIYCAFEDEEVFEGEGGDGQFEIYRSVSASSIAVLSLSYRTLTSLRLSMQMREHTKGEWETFHPLTNLMVSSSILDA